MGSLGLISHPVSGVDIDSFRQKEIEEKEPRNCRYRSKTDSRISVGAAVAGRTRFENARSSEREPGELSDDSGSDGDVESERRIRKRDIWVPDDGTSIWQSFENLRLWFGTSIWQSFETIYCFGGYVLVHGSRTAFGGERVLNCN